MQEIPIYEDKTLLYSVAQGDESAFHTLFDLYRDKVYYFACKLIRSESKAEDVLQEIFLKIWINREKLQYIDNFKAYLYALTRNHIYNALRKQANEEIFLQKLFSRENKVAGQPDVIDNLSLQEMQDALQKALATLTPHQKKVFELSRTEGLKHEEISEQLGISRNTVKKHISDALHTIRSQLKPLDRFVPLALLLFLARF